MNPDVPLEAAAPEREEARITPIGQQSRITDIDVLRGIALFGVLMMNLMLLFRVPLLGEHPKSTGIDYVVNRIQMVVLQGKAMTTFSILFGAGLAIFLERASARVGDARATRLLLRRLLFLLGFGLLHVFFVWDGDILVEYSLSGMLALLFIRRSNKVLLAAIPICMLVPSLEYAWPASKAFLFVDQTPALHDEALRVYATGSYLDVVRYRTFHEILVVHWRDYLFFFPYSLKNMLIGILVWRSGILRAPREHLRVLRWTALVGLTLGTGYLFYRWVLAEPYHLPLNKPSALRLFLSWFFITLLAIGYCAGILLLMGRARWRKWLGFFSPLGRMAFTNYLTESLAFSTMFYGYGFGLIGKLGEAKTALIGIAFYIIQGIISPIWLRHFKFGPFEWAWRSLTYGKLQPLGLDAGDRGALRDAA